MTPASIFWALRPDELGRAVTPSAAYASRLRRSSDDALRSRESPRWPEADLTMKDDVTVTVGRARFQALCQALRPDLLRFAFWLSRDLALAEDVVQETLLRAWKSRDSLQNEAAAKPWFLTIIRREYARTFERKRPVTVDVDELISREEPIFAATHDQDLVDNSGSARGAACRVCNWRSIYCVDDTSGEIKRRCSRSHFGYVSMLGPSNHNDRLSIAPCMLMESLPISLKRSKERIP